MTLSESATWLELFEAWQSRVPAAMPNAAGEQVGDFGLETFIPPPIGENLQFLTLRGSVRSERARFATFVGFVGSN
jgi:hypothetical protein